MLKYNMSFKDRVGKYRRSHKTRIVFIIILIIIFAVIALLWKKVRVWFIGLIILLFVSLGMELKGTDWDVGKLIKTWSFDKSKIERTASGKYWKIGDECTKETLDCKDFKFQEDAQDYFEKCGGVENDVSGLDRDHDGKACESLPSKKNK